MWWSIKRRVVRKRSFTATQHYISHKESARAHILERLIHFNQFYQLPFNRVAIRNQRGCWGSCSAKKNLNFNYKILFLPTHLTDYIIVHELCHLKEMNHGQQFWNLVALQLPEYKNLKRELRTYDALSRSGKLIQNHPQCRIESSLLVPETA